VGFRDAVQWIGREYGPQAQYEDYKLRKHDKATPGRIKIEYFNGLELQVIDVHVIDHDVTEDQFGNIQYIQLLHDDGHIQIVRASSFVVEFWASYI
jgi:hypothetical protein